MLGGSPVVDIVEAVVMCYVNLMTHSRGTYPLTRQFVLYVFIVLTRVYTLLAPSYSSAVNSIIQQRGGVPVLLYTPSVSVIVRDGEGGAQKT